MEAFSGKRFGFVIELLNTETGVTFQNVGRDMQLTALLSHEEFQAVYTSPLHLHLPTHPVTSEAQPDINIPCSSSGQVSLSKQLEKAGFPLKTNVN